MFGELERLFDFDAGFDGLAVTARFWGFCWVFATFVDLIDFSRLDFNLLFIISYNGFDWLWSGSLLFIVEFCFTFVSKADYI